MLLDWIASAIVPESAADLLSGSLDEVITLFSTSVYTMPEKKTGFVNMFYIIDLYL